MIFLGAWIGIMRRAAIQVKPNNVMQATLVPRVPDGSC